MSGVIVVGTSHGLALVFGKFPLYCMCTVVKCISHSKLYTIQIQQICHVFCGISCFVYQDIQTATLCDNQ